MQGRVIQPYAKDSHIRRHVGQPRSQKWSYGPRFNRGVRHREKGGARRCGGHCLVTPWLHAPPAFSSSRSLARSPHPANRAEPPKKCHSPDPANSRPDLASSTTGRRRQKEDGGAGRRGGCGEEKEDGGST
ncbi:Os01g0294100 [Oryza sativa Japonica Group]|uniref:Os01g0294100 protein n=1 Tax=Oryza sativa subsp. japonica TaxID=39947 RepID=A0A0P0V185_ORYSJ|nr:Os01g0294100 [Oryza sativa Japonica Group]